MSPPGLLHFSSLQELLQGSLASHSWSEFLSGWLLPTWHWWSSPCGHLGQLLGWRQLSRPPTSSSLLSSSLLLSISPRVGGPSSLGIGCSAGAGCSTCAACTSAWVYPFLVFSSSPYLGMIFIQNILEWKTNQSETRVALWKSHGILFWTGYSVFSKFWHRLKLFTIFIMSWGVV